MTTDNLTNYLKNKYSPGSPVLYRSKGGLVVEGVIVSMVDEPHRSYHSFMVQNKEGEIEVRLSNLTLRSNPLLSDVRL